MPRSTCSKFNEQCCLSCHKRQEALTAITSATRSEPNNAHRSTVIPTTSNDARGSRQSVHSQRNWSQSHRNAPPQTSNVRSTTITPAPENPTTPNSRFRNNRFAQSVTSSNGMTHRGSASNGISNGGRSSTRANAFQRGNNNVGASQIPRNTWGTHNNQQRSNSVFHNRMAAAHTARQNLFNRFGSRNNQFRQNNNQAWTSSQNGNGNRAWSTQASNSAAINWLPNQRNNNIHRDSHRNNQNINRNNQNTNRNNFLRSNFANNRQNNRLSSWNVPRSSIPSRFGNFPSSFG